MGKKANKKNKTPRGKKRGGRRPGIRGSQAWPWKKTIFPKPREKRGRAS